PPRALSRANAPESRAYSASLAVAVRVPTALSVARPACENRALGAARREAETSRTAPRRQVEALGSAGFAAASPRPGMSGMRRRALRMHAADRILHIIRQDDPEADA